MCYQQNICTWHDFVSIGLSLSMRRRSWQLILATKAKQHLHGDPLYDPFLNKASLHNFKIWLTLFEIACINKALNPLKISVFCKKWILLRESWSYSRCFGGPRAQCKQTVSNKHSVQSSHSQSMKPFNVETGKQIL